MTDGGEGSIKKAVRVAGCRGGACGAAVGDTLLNIGDLTLRHRGTNVIESIDTGCCRCPTPITLLLLLHREAEANINGISSCITSDKPWDVAGAHQLIKLKLIGFAGHAVVAKGRLRTLLPESAVIIFTGDGRGIATDQVVPLGGQLGTNGAECTLLQAMAAHPGGARTLLENTGIAERAAHRMDGQPAQAISLSRELVEDLLILGPVKAVPCRPRRASHLLEDAGIALLVPDRMGVDQARAKALSGELVEAGLILRATQAPLGD